VRPVQLPESGNSPAAVCDFERRQPEPKVAVCRRINRGAGPRGSDVWPGARSGEPWLWGAGGKPQGSSAKRGRPEVRQTWGTAKWHELRGGLPR